MKVAISIPDRIFEAAERLAGERGVPRSQLFAEALEAYLAEHGPGVVTERLNRVYASEASKVDEGFAQAQFGTLDHEAW